MVKFVSQWSELIVQLMVYIYFHAQKASTRNQGLVIEYMAQFSINMRAIHPSNNI